MGAVYRMIQRRVRLTDLLACAFVAAVLCPTLAWSAPLPPPLPVLTVGQDSPAVIAAREHNVAGLELIEQGRVEQAVAEFRKSYLAYPIPKTLFNLAAVHEDLGEYQDALSLYLAYRDVMRSIRAKLIAEQAQGTPNRSATEVEQDLAAVDANLGDAEAAIQTLRAQLTTRMVRMQIEVDPPQGKLYVDGAELLPIIQGVDELWVYPGNYTLSAKAPGFETKQRDVELRAGPVFRWTAVLDKVQPKHAGGAVAVRANVPGAVAFVAGLRAGVTPLSSYPVPTGPVDIRIEADGHVPFMTRVEVTEGATVSVEANLARDDERWAQRDTAWTLVGSGAGVFAIGAVVVGTAIAKANGANDDNDAGAFDSARSQYAAGWALVGVGGAAAIAGTVMLLLDEEPSFPVVDVAPLGQDGAYVGARWTF